MDFTYEEVSLLMDILFDAICNPDYSKEKSDAISDIREKVRQYRDYGHVLNPVNK